MKSLLFFPLFILVSSCLFAGCLALGIGAGASSETLITDRLSPPTLVTYSPDPTNINKPTLDWKDVTAATKYHIQIDDNPEFSSPVVDNKVDISNYTSPPLPDEKYYWRVSSMDEAGNESDFSEVDVFTVDTEPPPVPTFVPYDPDPTNDNMPTLDWDDMTGAIKYHIQIDNDSDFNSPVIEDDSVPLSTYSPSPLIDGEYHWRVKSIDEAGNESGFSSVDIFTVNTVVPGVPTLIPYSPDPTNNKTPTLDWIDVTGAAKYHIQIDDDSDFSSPVVKENILASTYTPSALSDGTYFWRVSTIDEVGNESDFSSPDSFTLDTKPLPSPTLVTYSPDPTNDDAPTLDWDDVTDATKYHIQIDDDSDFSSPVVDDDNVFISDYTPTLALSDGTHYWRVSSVDEAGNESSFSETDVFTVDTVAPGIPTLVAHPDSTNDNIPTFDWDDISGAIKHRIQIDDDSGFTSPLVDDSDVSVSTYTSPLLTDGTYHWRVNSIDEAGNESNFSEANTFTVETVIPATNTMNPASGSAITLSTPIVITFNESMNPTTLILGGTMASESDGGVWSTTTFASDTLTVGSANTWTDGSGRILTIDVKDTAGNSLLSTLSLSYGVLDGVVYVNDSNGNDANPGTPDLPKKTIQVAIDLADSLYNIAQVHIAEGTYNVDYQSGTHIAMKEGVSIYGGYSLTDWSVRDPSTHETIVQDTSISGGTSDDPNRAIHVGSSVTAATVMDGLTIKGGGGSYSSAINTEGSSTIQNNTINGGSGLSNSYGIYNDSSSSPTIQNNTINGGSGGTSSFGIINSPSSSPTIQNNTINGGSGGGSSTGIINSPSSSPTIQNNSINGGSGVSASTGINAGGSPMIQNNTINGGSGGASSYGIRLNGTPTIENNTIFTSGGGSNRYCIYEDDIDYDPVSVRNNDLFDCPTAIYYDFDMNCGGTDCTLVEMESLADMTASGNASDTPTFVNKNGPDGNINTMEDNNWRLQPSSSDNILQGGLDGNAEGWGFTTDKDGNTRTAVITGSPTNTDAAGWSMGAYEQD